MFHRARPSCSIGSGRRRAVCKTCAVVRIPQDVARRDHKENCNHHAHSRCQRRVHPSRGLHSLDVQQRKHQRKEDRPRPVRHARRKHVRLLAAPDGADDRIEHVIHHHAPASDVTKRGIDFLADVGEGRAGTGIGARHAAIADGGEQHCHHGDQDRRNDVPVSAVAEHTKHRHRRDRLNHDHSIQNQVPKGKRAPQAREVSGRVCSRTHSRSQNKTPLSCGDNGVQGGSLVKHKILLEFYTEGIFCQ